MWDAFPGRQLPSLQYGVGGEGEAGGVMGGPVARTPPPDRSIAGTLAGFHHQTRTATTPVCPGCAQNPGSDTGASNLLTDQLASNTQAFWSFYVIFGARQLLLQ